MSDDGGCAAPTDPADRDEPALRDALPSTANASYDVRDLLAMVVDDGVLYPANEGDLFGGSRGFTVWAPWGLPLYDSGNTVEHVAALAAGAVAVLCGVVAPAPQARAQATPCAVTEVTVVVAGQGTGCAPAGLDGLTTLRRAGFSVTMVQTQPGFICRINGTPASDPCVTTPPADSYWAYYHAPLGGTWQYSTLGASARTAAAGTVEGWAFGDGARPGSVPTAPRTQVATTRPSSSSTPPRTTTPSGGNQVTRATTRPPAPTAVDAGPPAGPGRAARARAVQRTGSGGIPGSGALAQSWR